MIEASALFDLKLVCDVKDFCFGLGLGGSGGLKVNLLSDTNIGDFCVPLVTLLKEAEMLTDLICRNLMSIPKNV
jgi:hypothetical protein